MTCLGNCYLYLSTKSEHFDYLWLCGTLKIVLGDITYLSGTYSLAVIICPYFQQFEDEKVFEFLVDRYSPNSISEDFVEELKPSPVRPDDEL